MAHPLQTGKTVPPSGERLYIPSEIGSQLAKASLRVLELENEVQAREDHIALFKKALHTSREEVARIHEELVRTREELVRTRQELSQAEKVVRKSQRGWTRRSLDHFLPPGSARRSFIKRAVRLVTKLARRNRPLAAQPPLPVPPPAAPDSLESRGAASPGGPPEPEVLAAAGPYARWIKDHEPGPAELEKQRAVRFPRAPRVSLLVAAGDTPARLVEAMLRSVLRQTYGNWEVLVVADEGQPAGARGVIQEFCRQDSRIRVVAPAPGREPALAAATGEYVAFVEAADTLAPFALFEVVQALNQHPDADFLYSDEDYLSATGEERSDPHFKPDWSPDTLRSHNYVADLAVFSRALLEKVGAGGSRRGCRNYDLILRASEHARQVVHVPRILYHRRLAPGAAPGQEEATPEAREAALQALNGHLRRSGTAAEATEGPWPGTYRLAYALPGRPLVSIIIPNKDNADMLACCLNSIRQRTGYRPYEIVILENGSERAETFAYYEELARHPDVHVHTWARPFNYAAICNEGARRSKGEVLLFLNNDVQVINADWLERLLEHALRPGVGAVGAKLYYPDDTLQHGGITVGRRHGPYHYFHFAGRDATGYRNRLVVVQNVAAVTGACLMTRREVFERVGGFDEEFVISFNDVDLCLKIRHQGYRVVWTPYAELYHFESVTRGYCLDPKKRAQDEAEKNQFWSKWEGILPAVDPYFNPNFALHRADCSFAA